MKTPRQLARTCGRRRCVLPTALFGAVLYLLVAERQPQQAPPPVRTQDLLPLGTAHMDSLSLPAPTNLAEREALAQHLAAMATPGGPSSSSTTVEAATLSGPESVGSPAASAVPAAPAPPPQSAEAKRSAARAKAAMASVEKHLQRDADKHEAPEPVHTAAGASPALGTGVSTAGAGAAAAGEVKPGPLVSPRVATFYYPWYGTPDVDGKWAHWDHPQIEHWDTKQRDRYPHGEKTRRVPPASVGSNFYPESGPYSSRDPAVVATHMRQMREAVR
jgi:hypothetical protein